MKISSSNGVAVLARIGTLAPSLRESERRIADYALARPEEIVHLSVSELADRTGTSEATAIRFAQRLGFPGYSALKIALALELRGTAAPPGELGSEGDLGAIKQRVLQVYVDSLNDMAQLLDESSVQQAVEALIAAPRIEIYGVGGTGALAQDAYFMFKQIGLPAVALTDSHLQLMSAVQLRPGDVALGISLSGSTRDTVDALSAARDAGATSLCITRHARSPITMVAHVTLLAVARPAMIGGHQLLGRSTTMAVIDVLATAVALARPQESLDVLERTRAVIYQHNKRVHR